MTRIGLAVDDPSLCELFILRALIDEGISPVLLYPNGVNDPDDLEGIPVVINRMVHRQNRLSSTEDLTSMGIQVLNPYSLEFFCTSKPSMKRAFDANGVQTARWYITEHPLTILRNGKIGMNKRLVGEVSETIKERTGYPVVIKPTDGSRGLSVLKIDSEEELCNTYSSCSGQPPSNVPNALYRNTTNPQGLLIEGFLPHALDLRCLVSKRRGEGPEYLGCLARVAEDEEQIAKNTALGAIPVGIDAPDGIRDMAVESVEAGLRYLSSLGFSSPEYLLLGVDIIPSCSDLSRRSEIYEAVAGVSQYKERIKRTKSGMKKILGNGRGGGVLREYRENLTAVLSEQRFMDALHYLDTTFDEFKSSDGYERLLEAICIYLGSSEPYVGEINARVDFGTNTRNLAIPDLHEKIVEVALSI